MNNFSKVVILLIILLSFLFATEKIGLRFPKFEPQKKYEEIVKIPSEIIKKEDKITAQTVDVYFLALDKNDNGIYKKVTRTVKEGEKKIDVAIKELLKGPDTMEKAIGAYSEIPKTVKLLGIEDSGNKIIINLSSDFQYGGGTDSIYSRMMQLIKTSVANADNKKVYLYLDGKQIKLIGGEGIMITQPLSEKSLEN